MILRLSISNGWKPFLVSRFLFCSTIYALRIHICLFVVKYPQKMKPASSANEAGFIGTWSKLRWHLKLYSFFCHVFRSCGLTILVDHFKLYLYYELTQLLLIYNSRWRLSSIDDKKVMNENTPMVKKICGKRWRCIKITIIDGWKVWTWN